MAGAGLEVTFYLSECPVMAHSLTRVSLRLVHSAKDYHNRPKLNN